MELQKPRNKQNQQIVEQVEPTKTAMIKEESAHTAFTTKDSEQINNILAQFPITICRNYPKTWRLAQTFYQWITVPAVAVSKHKMVYFNFEKLNIENVLAKCGSQKVLS